MGSLASDSIEWRGHQITIKAKRPGRNFWTTALIDVMLDDRLVLKTDEGLLLLEESSMPQAVGEFELGVGSSERTPGQSNEAHTIEINWGGEWYSRTVPCRVSIDGHTLFDSVVDIDNWPYVLIYQSIVIGIFGVWLVVAIGFLFLLLCELVQ